jgi:hypothetical protein
MAGKEGNRRHGLHSLAAWDRARQKRRVKQREG